MSGTQCAVFGLVSSSSGHVCMHAIISMHAIIPIGMELSRLAHPVVVFHEACRRVHRYWLLGWNLLWRHGDSIRRHELGFFHWVRDLSKRRRSTERNCQSKNTFSKVHHTNQRVYACAGACIEVNIDRLGIIIQFSSVCGNSQAVITGSAVSWTSDPSLLVSINTILVWWITLKETLYNGYQK